MILKQYLYELLNIKSYTRTYQERKFSECLCDVNIFFDREEIKVVCHLQSKPQGETVNTKLPVIISWEDPVVSDQDSGQFFTYKPDPVIADIHPYVTIRRYEINFSSFAKANTSNTTHYFHSEKYKFMLP